MKLDDFIKTLAELDDKIVDADQEDLDAIDKLLEERVKLVDSFVPEEFVPEIPADEREEPVEPIEPVKPAVKDLEVNIREGYLYLKSVTDVSVEVGGDVRDGIVKLKAGKVSKRKLTSEGHKFVVVDGVKYPSV